ncbi:hypothetical protein ACGFWE_07795 [Streptomyces sp. NPDC048523]|uniref:hypothetical protein n=1 Tax=Streptomyces sp. NPDC048523 TaxID=3365567 RepID=UPI0037189E19
MDGLVPALWVGARAVAVAAVLAFLMSRQRTVDGPAAGLSGNAAATAPVAI